MTRTLGWDVGGAHLKAVLAEKGEVLKAWQEPTPIWKGLEHLDASLDSILGKVGDVSHHAVTMTGELSDIFADRSEGVRELTKILSGRLGGGMRLYAGEAGFVSAWTLGEHSEKIASANWHASAALTAVRMEEALFVDMGSTTTDIVPVKNGRVLAHGQTDAARLLSGELVYQGHTRTALMAVAHEISFGGRRTPIMAEFFATMADVQRILGALDEDDDQYPAADGKEKTVAASRARLARMIGRDASDATPAALEHLAEGFAEAQIRRIHDAALTVLSRGEIADDAPVVVAGAGRNVVKRLAARLDRGVVDFCDLVDCRSDLRAAIGRAAPAAALAILAEDAASKK
ncbi:MAG: S-layer protein [Rhizobiaceae bacterium]|nr:S-layer protein [Rhizobiaceae bacterium]